MDGREGPGFDLRADSSKELRFSVSATDVSDTSLRARLVVCLSGSVSVAFEANVDGTDARVVVPPLASLVNGIAEGNYPAVLEVFGERSRFEAWNGVARLKKPAEIIAKLVESTETRPESFRRPCSAAKTVASIVSEARRARDGR